MQSIESWISEDLAKSGLPVEDIEVLPLMPKIKRDGSIIHHGGYQIIYRDAQGVLMKGCRNQPFVRERFRPPLPLDLQGGKKKYGTPAGAGIRIFFPKNVYRFAPVRQYIICGSTQK